jgi:hypothetical protein
MLRTKSNYTALIRQFVDGLIGAQQFEKEYLQLFKSDETRWQGVTFEVLDGLFAAVDQYCADETLRERTNGLDERELLDAAQSALVKLDAAQ